jgi:type 1 glutamine amidotransferase
VWTRDYGKGRVVTILPAHWPEAYKLPEFQQLIANSVRWVAKEKPDE